MSFQKFMNKKDFHPGSFRNIKMAWEAEEKTRLAKDKEDNIRAEYEREQETYRNRQQMAGSGGNKLQLNFMYDLPPGMRREDMPREEDEAEIGADGMPRLKMEKKKPAITSKQDGVEESDTIGPKRHMQCYRCNKWGHANTDRICPLFDVPRDEDKFTQEVDSLKLIREMRHDGFAFNRSLYGGVINIAQQGRQGLILADDSEDQSTTAAIDAAEEDMKLVAGLSKKQKRKLLKKLESIDDPNADITKLLAAAVREEHLHQKTKKPKKEKRMPSDDSHGDPCGKHVGHVQNRSRDSKQSDGHDDHHHRHSRWDRRSKHAHTDRRPSHDDGDRQRRREDNVSDGEERYRSRSPRSKSGRRRSTSPSSPRQSDSKPSTERRHRHASDSSHRDDTHHRHDDATTSSNSHRRDHSDRHRHRDHHRDQDRDRGHASADKDRRR